MKLDLVKLRIGDEDREFYVRAESSDAQVVNQVFCDLDFDFSRLARFDDLEDFLRKARATGKRPLIIDGGANIGAASVYFSGQCQDALVVAIEPEESNYQLLVENTKGMSVLPLPCALASKPQRMRIVDAGNGCWGFRTMAIKDEEAKEDDVSSVSIDEIFTAHSSDCFSFIVKIDIEGGEKELFQQHTEWIGRTPLIIIELHDWMLPGQGVALPFLRSICRFERDFVHVGEHIFSIANDLDALVAIGDLGRSARGIRRLREDKR